MGNRESILKRSILPIAGLLVCVLSTNAAYAQISREQLAESAACGIQQALLRSPGDYVIAIVEHPGILDCNEISCREALKIVRLLASRTYSGRRYAEQTLFVEASREAQIAPLGFRSFIVAAPIPHAANYFLPITHGPVDKPDERLDEAAVKLAMGPPVGPLCKKTLPADFRILRPKKE